MKKIVFKNNVVGDISVSITDKLPLNEALTKEDVKEIEKMFSKLFKNSLTDIEKNVKDIIKKELGTKATEDKIVEISKNCIVQLYKTLWVRRSSWANGIKNLKA